MESPNEAGGESPQTQAKHAFGPIGCITGCTSILAIGLLISLASVLIPVLSKPFTVLWGIFIVYILVRWVFGGIIAPLVTWIGQSRAAQRRQGPPPQ